jgi:glycosyltransferase involved in cell wall biosynthesis
MHVLLDHPNPFHLAHGGFQVQILQTHRGIKEAGVQVEWLRWWDEQQPVDVIHYFGRPPLPYLAMAHNKGIKVVLEELLTGVGSRAPRALALERMVIRFLRRTLPCGIHSRFGWDAYRLSDACVANTELEAHLMRYLFGARPERVHVVPNGVEEVFFETPRVPRGKWLVCSGTITERKRMFELAEAAVKAGCPVWIVGKPYSETDPYGRRFLALAQAHPNIIRYEGSIPDRLQLARVYREARGFVLLSTQETRSLSSEEAAACECPLLLSDLPWAHSVFGSHAWYCPLGSVEATAARLKEFYDAAPRLQPPPKPMPWVAVGHQFRRIYEEILMTSRQE